MNKTLEHQRRSARVLYVVGLIVIALLCTVEALTKGWLLFVFLPALVIVLPLLFIGQVGFTAELYGFSRRVYRAIASLRGLQIAGLLAFYVCAVGFGEGDRVTLFGFVTTTVGSPLTVLSGILSTVGAAVFGATSIALLTFFVVSLLQKKIRRRFAKIVD